MFASLLQSMLPPGFDLEKTINDVKNAIGTAVATVQRIEEKQDAILAALTAQAATVTVPYPESNHDNDQLVYLAGNPASTSPGDASAAPGANGDAGRDAT